MAQRRWMMFVDGENLAIRGKDFASTRGFDLLEGEHYLKDVFVWMPGLSATHALTQPQKGNPIEPYAHRAHYWA